MLSGKNGVEAIVIAGSRATNSNSRAASASRMLILVKKSGLFQKIQGKISLILDSIDTHDLKNTKLKDKAKAAQYLGEIAGKLSSSHKYFT